MRIAILGGGISGIMAGYYLFKNRVDFKIFESSSEIGGLCRTYVRDGFTFDMAGVHVLHSKNEETLKFMLKILDGNCACLERTAKIHFRGRWVPFPFSSSLSELEWLERVRCITSYFTSKFRQKVLRAEAQNFLDWLILTYGKRVSDIHYIPYGQKIWKCDLSKVSFEWINSFIPPPQFIPKPMSWLTMSEPIKRSYIYHPQVGGIQAFVMALAKEFYDHIQTDTPVQCIEKSSQNFKVNGETFDKIISTIPLPELVRFTRGLDQKLVEVASKLRYLSLITLLIGSTRRSNTADSWYYIPSKRESPLHRVTWMNNIGSHNDSPQKFSIVGEMTVPGGTQFIITDKFIDKCLNSLESLNLLSRKEINFVEHRKMEYAYILGDLSYSSKVEYLQDGLRNYGIRLLGRFGEFKYLNIDHIIVKSRQLVEQLIQELN